MGIRVNFVHQDNRPNNTVLDAVFMLDHVPARTDKVMFNMKTYTVYSVFWHLHPNDCFVTIELND